MAEIKDKKESKKDKRDRKLEKKEKKRKMEESDEKVEKDEDPEQEAEELEQTEDSEKKAEDSDSEDGDSSELEIDLNALVPLSKKQQRLLKKGKLDLDRLARKNPPPKPISDEPEKPAKSQFGVWIGNLSYDTTKEDLTRFVVGKTASFDEDETDFITVKDIDITRVNLPKKANKIKGFAYLDLPSLKHVESVVSLSEQHLNGRNLLIKNSSSFEGRPEADATKLLLLKNPPLRILFAGNLSFDTTEDNLEEHFRAFGDIVRIRMATFQDTGKCKGFAFIDFKDETGPTAALKSKLAKKFINRNLRLEFGEDRSKRTPKRLNSDGEPVAFTERSEVVEGEITERPERAERTERFDKPERGDRFERSDRPPRPQTKRPYRESEGPSKRLKSSVALATAQRASAAIVPSQGKKITFD